MTLNYNVIGERRKALIHAIEEFTGVRAKYQGIATQAFTIGSYTVSKTGELSWEKGTGAEMVIETLLERGFEAEATGEPETVEEPEEAQPTEEQNDNLVISLPIKDFDVDSLNRLHALVASKRTLLEKVLETETLPIEVTEDRVSFPWFQGELDADHVQAYSSLICQICNMAKNSKRVTGTDKPTENEKYAFRCWLLRLGFIGDKFKNQRRILLEKLDGNSAFRTGARKEGEQ